MDFMDCLKNESSKQLTENGAVGYATTGKALLDFNFKLPSYRKDKDLLERDLEKIICEKDPYLLKYLYYLRDCRDGLGERDAFRRCIVKVLNSSTKLEDKTVQILIFLIPFYGRWDDLFVFFDTDYEKTMLSLVCEQFNTDLDIVSKAAVNGEKKPISLLAKWLPSDNASSKQSRYFAHKIAKTFGLTVREYRKSVVMLRKYLDVLEQKACANRWDEIDYSTVPSNANLRYKNAFINHDYERRVKFFEALRNKEDGAKINSAVNFPYEIVAKYKEDVLVYSYYDYKKAIAPDAALEALWDNLKDMPGLDDTLVIRDGSASMTSHMNNKATAADVADALAIYCAARCGGPYKDTFITFSSEPEIVSLTGKETLFDKLRFLRTFDDCSNTDLERTFELILNTAAKNNLKQEDLPKQLLIVSDMEFDMCTYGNRKALLEHIADKFKEAGYTIPKLVFWNVNSRTNTIPLRESEAGVILVSGFSLGAINMVLSGKLDPREAITDVLNSDRYEDIPLFE